MATTTKRADFEAVFPKLAEDILAHAKRYNLPANALEWFEKVGQIPRACEKLQLGPIDLKEQLKLTFFI